MSLLSANTLLGIGPSVRRKEVEKSGIVHVLESVSHHFVNVRHVYLLGSLILERSSCPDSLADCKFVQAVTKNGFTACLTRGGKGGKRR